VREVIGCISSKSDVSMAADTVQGVFMKANGFFDQLSKKKPNKPNNSILS